MPEGGLTMVELKKGIYFPMVMISDQGECSMETKIQLFRLRVAAKKGTIKVEVKVETDDDIVITFSGT